MLCQKCHKNLATMRYAEVVDGQVAEQLVCPECLNTVQAGASGGFEFTEPTPVARKRASDSITHEAVRMLRECKSCGMRLNEIVDTARVGCPECYAVFGRQIEGILEGLHRSLQHQGRVQCVDDDRARLHADLQAKRALMRTVLKAEKYEDAARLRDEIRCLESGLQMSKSGAD